MGCPRESRRACRGLANARRGSFLVSGSGGCSLLCSSAVPDCSTCPLLASLCCHTNTLIEQTKPKTAKERRLVALCMSSSFPCCVPDQGGLLCFPFFNCRPHSFQFVPLFLSLLCDMQMILCRDRDLDPNVFALPTCQRTKLATRRNDPSERHWPNHVVSFSALL